MNVLLWILQVAVAFLYVSGGVYKMFRFDQLAGFMQAIPRGGWRALGLLEVVGGLLLVIPMTIGWMPALTPLAAVALAIETLGIAAVYAKHSRKLTAANPLVWATVMALLAALVAVGRWSLV